MLEALDGALILVAGGWISLVATGRIALTRNPDRARIVRRKYGVPLAVLGAILIAWGLYRLSGFVMAGG